ncbi:riboflavin biosynthesis protein PYRR, chloroplastic, partial [Tanacetum coccineum]
MPISMGFTTLTPITCKLPNNNNHALDATYIKRAAELSDKSACFTSPHPNFGCVIARNEKVVGEGYLYAQGTTPAEV